MENGLCPVNLTAWNVIQGLGKHDIGTCHKKKEKRRKERSRLNKLFRTGPTSYVTFGSNQSSNPTNHLTFELESPYLDLETPPTLSTDKLVKVYFYVGVGHQGGA